MSEALDPPHLYKLGPSRLVVQDRKTVKSLDPFKLNRTRWQLRAYFRDAFWHVNARATKRDRFCGDSLADKSARHIFHTQLVSGIVEPSARDCKKRYVWIEMIHCIAPGA